MPITPIECSMKRRANIGFRLSIRLMKFWRRPIKNIFETPIIINNFNRLSFLKKQINWLENAGYKNIYIIDNNSDYKPLIDYYNTLPYKIYQLDKNMGYNALWDTHIILRFISDYYVYTDPDILPISDCPKNVLLHMKNLLLKYTDVGKIGFGLAINDLPEQYSLKEKVISYEAKYWKIKINDEVYDALVDTTFALYRPFSVGDWQLKAYRTDYPFIARHLPWYENTTQPSEEEIYYINSSNKNSLWYTNLKTSLNK